MRECEGCAGGWGWNAGDDLEEGFWVSDFGWGATLGRLVFEAGGRVGGVESGEIVEATDLPL